MDSELKPCPFCGAKEFDEDEPLNVWFVSEDDDEWRVECDRCGANTGWFNRQSREEAIEAWNKRAKDEE